MAVSPPPVQWGILDSNGRALLSPDSVIRFELRGEVKVANYPVEQGSFSSYNQVYEAFDARLTVACNGQGVMTRKQFLDAVESLRNSLTLASIATPDAVYKSMKLVHYDYRRESTQGVTLLLVDLWFHEVRIAGQSVAPTAQPDGASPTQQGQLAPTQATTDQLAAYNQTAIA